MRMKKPQLISSGLVAVGIGIILLSHNSPLRLVGLVIVLIGGVLLFRHGPYYE